MSSTTAYFQEKRLDNKEQVVGIAFMDSMVFDTGYATSRGIKPWEKARYENQQQRLRNQEFFQKQQKKNTWVDDTEKKTKQEREEKERKVIAQRLWDAEHPFEGFVPSGNDAWDD
jgi:hypothetical protein